MKTTQKDYLIVGGGLAGCLLAHTLIKAGKTVLVVEDKTMPTASRVAAGTWNPIAFRRMVTTWRADEFIAEMDVVYGELEALLETKFYYKKSSVKILANQQEEDFWLEQAKNIPDYLSTELLTLGLTDKKLGEVYKTGRVDLNHFLDVFIDFLIKNESFLSKKFDFDDFLEENDSIRYENYFFDKVVFCEGPFITQNPYFNWLPFKMVNGDVLTIKATGLKLDKILKKNIFVLPLGDGFFNVGATYNWDNLVWEPNENAKAFLIEKLNHLIDIDFEVIDHKAGVRPASFDRRPIIGAHPDKENLFVFNGFGSKGVFLAPLMAKEMLEFLEHKTPLNAEVSINRYVKKHYQKL